MSQSTTSKQYLSQMNLIYFVQAGVMLVFAGVVFALVYSGKFAPSTDKELTDKLTYLLLVIVIGGLSGSHFLYRNILSRIDKSLDLKKKMPRYLGALMLRSACLELPGLAASVVFFMTANYYLLAIPIFTFLVFFMLRPTPSSIVEDMQLSDKEKAMLNNPNAVIVER
jgi:hypothetical protein